jgi:hypothetical protein
VLCNTSSSFSGGSVYPRTEKVTLGSSTGLVNISLEPYTVPDRMIVNFDGVNVIDTKYVGDHTLYQIGASNRGQFTASLTGKIDPISGLTYPNIGISDADTDNYPKVNPNPLVPFSFNKNTSTDFIYINMYGPMDGTIWSYSVNCPIPFPSVTPSRTPSITPSSTPSYGSILINPQNSLSSSSYNVYINGILDETFKSGLRTYIVGTTISISYSNPACNVQLDDSGYSSGNVITLTSSGTKTFTLYNNDYWYNIGSGYCSSCISYENQQNLCGGSRSIVGGNYCNINADYSSNVGTFYNCSNGTVNSYIVYQNTNGCFGGNQYSIPSISQTYSYNPSNGYPNTSEQWTNNGSPFCSNCDLYQPQINTNTCSSTYGSTRNGLIEINSTSCGGCCGQSTSPSYSNMIGYYCLNCVNYEVYQNTNGCYGGDQQYYIPGLNQLYNYNPVNGVCNTTPNWVNNGSQSCNGYTLEQSQIDNNPCSSTSGQFRVITIESNSVTCGYNACNCYTITNNDLDITYSYTRCSTGQPVNNISLSGGQMVTVCSSTYPSVSSGGIVNQGGGCTNDAGC